MTPCGDQVDRWVGDSYERMRHPGGPSGVLLKSNAPWIWAYAERRGLMLDLRRRFRVSTA